jgi:putative peptidoglycan lipid II flippase
VIPFALLLPVIASDVANVVWGHGASAGTYQLFVPSLALFGPGLVFFTVHYLMLRGFYALERNRTVFWIQCAVGAANIVAAVLLVRATNAEDTSPALVVSYGAAYLVGSVISYAVLSRVLGGLRTSTLIRFLVRALIAAGVSTAAAAATTYLLHRVAEDPHWSVAARWVLLVVLVDVVVFVAMAKALRLREVTVVVDTVTRRLPLPRRS